MADLNLNDALSSILSDPETGEKLQALISSLTSSEEGHENEKEEADNKSDSLPFPDIGKLMKIKDIYDSAIKEQDPHITLLSSLKPYLSETRNKNLDSMMKLLKIYKVFNKVKDTSLLKELF